MDSIISTVIGLFSGGTTGIVLRLILGVVVALFIWWLKKQLKKASHEATKKKRLKDQAESIQENKEIFDDANKVELELEEWIKQTSEDHKE